VVVGSSTMRTALLASGHFITASAMLQIGGIRRSIVRRRWERPRLES